MPSDTYTLTISDLGVAAVADNAVTTAKIANYDVAVAGTGVTTAKIVDLNVTTAKLAAGAVTTAKLETSSSTITGVTTAKIADDAVTTAKILNSAVTTAKLESYSGGSTGVTTAKIADLAVTTAKLADGAVMDAKITNGTITDAKLATISTALKVSNSATTATDANTASTIVARDGSKNFSAGIITAALTGNASTATSIAGGTAGQILYQSGPNTTQFIEAATAAGKLLVSGAGGTAAPTWGSAVGGVSSGGTGIYSYAAGDIIYADGATSLTKRAIGPAGSVLTSNGTIPVYLTTLPVASGGTGAASLTGYVKANGTAVMTASASVPVGEIYGTLPVTSGGTGVAASAYGQTGSQTAGTSTTYTTTYAKLLELTTSLDAAAQFDANSVNNRLRYTGSATRKFLVFASMDMLSSTNGTQFSIKIAKNDTVIDATQCNASVSIKSSGTGIAKLVSNWIIEFAQNDYVEIFVASVGSSETGTPQRMRLVATPVF